MKYLIWIISLKQNYVNLISIYLCAIKVLEINTCDLTHKYIYLCIKLWLQRSDLTRKLVVKLAATVSNNIHPHWGLWMWGRTLLPEINSDTYIKLNNQPERNVVTFDVYHRFDDHQQNKFKFLIRSFFFIFLIKNLRTHFVKIWRFRITVFLPNLSLFYQLLFVTSGKVVTT